jgi:hypothetical protein
MRKGHDSRPRTGSGLPALARTRVLLSKLRTTAVRIRNLRTHTPRQRYTLLLRNERRLVNRRLALKSSRRAATGIAAPGA